MRIASAPQEETGQAQTRLNKPNVVAAPSLTTPPPREVTVSESRGEEMPEPRVSTPARKDAVRVQAEEGPGLRRSSRTTKGKTTRFDDYEVGEE